MTKKTVLIIVIVAVLVMGMMGAGFYVIWNKVSSFKPEAKQESEKVAEEKEGKKKADEGMIGPIYSLDTFVVNLGDKGGKRYLRVTMDLELSNKELMEEIKKRHPQITDTILMVLPTKRCEDIQSVEGKIALRDEMISKINSFLKAGSVTNIYFKEFVIQ